MKADLPTCLARLRRRTALVPACLAMLLLVPPVVRATPQLGEWTPLFKGIDHTMGTNVPGGGMPNQHVVHVLRVDLTDPDLRLFSSPRLDNYVLNAAETGGYTVTDFLARHKLQVAVNAGLFDPQEYYLAAGTPMDIAGFSVSEGTVVSTQTSADNAATLAFTQDKVPTFIPTNWPPVSVAGVWTAVSGSYPILVKDVNLGSRYLSDPDFIHRTNPRTVYGITRDRKSLFLVTIDGRQPGYSTGANDYESAAWLVLLGCSDGVNMDGGGSTTLVVEDSTGKPLRLNHPSAVADSGRERTVGSHFGIYAKPAVGFINDLAVAGDDISASVTWTTIAPASSQVRYGLTTDLGSVSELLQPAVTNHSVRLTGLTPGTTYFYSALSDDGAGSHASPVRAFVTSNYVSTATLFDVTHEWKFAFANLDGVSWTTRSYDDSGWPGSGPGLLWVDSRGNPRSGIDPANTRMATDPSSGGYPYPTYYFRTHFDLPVGPAGVSLVLTNYLDDGAVFYLNGTEIARLRMADAPTPIAYTDLAVAFGCSGDATCPDVLSLAAAQLPSLTSGDNVLAVEVHNYNARSPDTTFGMSLTYSAPIVIRPSLAILAGVSSVTLTWDRPGFTVQAADDPAGPWADVAGPVTTSPWTTAVPAAARFYRLRRQ